MNKEKMMALAKTVIQYYFKIINVFYSSLKQSLFLYPNFDFFVFDFCLFDQLQNRIHF